MKISATHIFVLAAVSLLCLACHKSSEENQTEEPPVVRYEYGLPVDSFRIDTAVVKEGETLGGILNRLGATAQQVNKISIIPREQLDVRSLRAGKTYYALYQTDSTGIETLRYWIYLPDRRHATIIHMTAEPHVEYAEKPLEIQEKCAQAVISSSLWNAMVSQGLPVSLALELSEIYAWTIDFFALQEGDSIRV